MAKSASERITDEVTSWPGVTAGTGRRGEWSFKVGRKEVGHLHGDRAAHFVVSQVRSGPSSSSRAGSSITRCSRAGSDRPRAGSKTRMTCAT